MWKPAPAGAQSRQNDAQFTATDRRPDAWFGEVGQPPACRREGQREVRVVDGHGAGHVERERLTGPFELPTVEPFVTEADAQAPMRQQVVWMRRRSMPIQIAGCADHHPAQVGRQALGNHILSDGAAISDARIGPGLHDVEQIVGDADVDLDLRMALAEDGQHGRE